jgi:hypothetical protein
LIFRLAPMSGATLVLTVLALAVPAVGLVLAGRGGEFLAVPAFFVIAVYMWVWLRFRPTEFVVHDDALEIVWPLKSRRILRTDIASARLVSRREMRDILGFGLRVGVGGLWGAFGWLWTTRRGIVQMYISRTDGFVWIERKSTRPWLITPERPEEFLRSISVSAVSVLAIVAVSALSFLLLATPALAQSPPAAASDRVRTLVSRLDLEKYKATIKSLTQFGDRRQGTARNRAAVDWIEAQLKSYGCANTERLKYNYQPPPPAPAPAAPAAPAPNPPTAVGGGRPRGNRTRTGVNNDPNAQPDARIRSLNMEPSAPGPREEVYCTKIGSTHPDEMYIVGAHMDGIGWGEAANDDGSGTALVMELARVFSEPDVRTERSIRFILWNNEESGLDGSTAYVAQRRDLQGQERPAGSGAYPEPKWLGMIQHDMMLFDHGMPRAAGTMNPEQRPEADVNVEFQSNSRRAPESAALAWAFYDANEKYATDYPVAVGPHMTNTDSNPFMNDVAAISVRENERGTEIGSGWDPQWHQPTDIFATYSDKDFRLGLNAAQTTLGAMATLAGAAIGR